MLLSLEKWVFFTSLTICLNPLPFQKNRGLRRLTQQQLFFLLDLPVDMGCILFVLLFASCAGESPSSHILGTSKSRTEAIEKSSIVQHAQRFVPFFSGGVVKEFFESFWVGLCCARATTSPPHHTDIYHYCRGLHALVNACAAINEANKTTAGST
jgi:hypothetical protein